MPTSAPDLERPPHPVPTRRRALPRQCFVVVGMTDARAELAISEALIYLRHVSRITVDVAAGTVTVEALKALDPVEVSAAIAAAGYELVR